MLTSGKFKQRNLRYSCTECSVIPKYFKRFRYSSPHTLNNVGTVPLMYILEQIKIQFPTYFKVVGTVSYMYILEQIKVQFPTYFK